MPDYLKGHSEHPITQGQLKDGTICTIPGDVYEDKKGKSELKIIGKGGQTILGKFNMILSIGDDNTLTTANSILLARIDMTTDRKVLQDIKNKIEILQPDASTKLQCFLEERNKIIDLFNNDFIPKIRGMMTTIEDEGLLKGGCGLTYCPAMKYETENDPTVSNLGYR